MESYSDIVANISADKLQEKCSDDVCLKVGKDFTQWRDVAPHLQLEGSVVDEVDKGKCNERGKPFALLQRWREAKGSKATNEKLIQGLLAVGRTDLAELIAAELGELVWALEW